MVVVRGWCCCGVGDAAGAAADGGVARGEEDVAVVVGVGAVGAGGAEVGFFFVEGVAGCAEDFVDVREELGLFV